MRPQLSVRGSGSKFIEVETGNETQRLAEVAGQVMARTSWRLRTEADLACGTANGWEKQGRTLTAFALLGRAVGRAVIVGRRPTRNRELQ